MSEEEILKECTELAENEHHELGNCWDEEYSSSAIFGLIMLYKQTKKSEEVLANKLQEVNIALSNLKEIEQHHKADNGLLRQELDMQIEHNKELDNILYAKQSMIDELTQNEEKLKIELGKEKERNELFVVSGNSINLERHIKNNYIRKDTIKEMKKYREFELQQEYKVFEEDVEWRTYKKILEEK